MNLGIFRILGIDKFRTSIFKFEIKIDFCGTAVLLPLTLHFIIKRMLNYIICMNKQVKSAFKFKKLIKKIQEQSVTFFFIFNDFGIFFQKAALYHTHSEYVICNL